MMLFGLIGYPLTHSFSKKYFTEKFEKEQLDNYQYQLFPIGSIDQLKDILKKHPQLAGLNVTLPYKKFVISFLDEYNEVVSETGACNCIKIISGKLIGYNTDVIGFERSLTPHLKPHHNKALVLGTGGSAKAVQYVLKKSGIAFTSVSRNPLPDQLNYHQITEATIKKHTIIINCTPVGMYPDINESPPIPYNYLTPQHLLFDLIYNPEKTLFLQKAEEKGATIINGSEMLIIQAEESWKIWNGG